jgi:hypothetical protein
MVNGFPTLALSLHTSGNSHPINIGETLEVSLALIASIEVIFRDYF